MKKKIWLLGAAAALSFALTACGSEEPADKSAAAEKTDAAVKKDDAAKEQTITYLGQTYKLPAKADTIAAASLEAMEDAAVLGVKPAGAVTIGGKLPEYLAEDLAGAESIGEKMQPNYETLLSMKPDVILGSSKFQPDVAEKMNKIAVMIPVSHISNNWEDNLKLIGELTGKQAEAEAILNQYHEDAASLKEKIGENLKNKTTAVLRMRGGSLYVYPESVYFNPVLYSDLGLPVPEEVKAAKAQEVISLEQLAEMNPDYLFVQFEESENKDQPEALEELKKNAIWKSIQAVKDNKVFINSVDPLAQGGTAWSKSAFLKAAQQHLLK